LVTVLFFVADALVGEVFFAGVFFPEVEAFFVERFLVDVEVLFVDAPFAGVDFLVVVLLFVVGIVTPF